MKIRNTTHDEAWQIEPALQRAIRDSRFTAEVYYSTSGPKPTVEIEKVRLRKSKPYCGNHPNACERPTRRRNAKRDFLEGADWVEFNDLVNDVLDALAVSARFESSVVVARLGRRRRTNYGSKYLGQGFWVWEKRGDEADYSDFVGLPAPKSTYPSGTPGGVEKRASDAEN